MHWVLERTFAWLRFFRRLRIRWKRRAGIHEAFLAPGCAIAYQRYIQALLKQVLGLSSPERMSG